MKFWKSFVAAMICFNAMFCCGNAPAKDKSEWVFVASKKGIYTYRMDLETGAITNPGVVAEVTNPQFIAIHPNRPLLYTLNTAMLDGKKTGVVSAFSIEPKTGKLVFLSQQPSGGAGPTHLAVDGARKNILVANYGSGSVSVFPIGKDGSLGTATAFIQHQGSSVNPQRQEGPHAHHITADPGDRFVLACDLGLDKVLIYKFDSEKGALVPNDPPSVSLKSGAGPRHLAFHPNGRFAYVINELDSTLTAFSFDSRRGALKELQTLSTLPKKFSGKNFPAEVVVHPFGKFLYGSNRGHDSIVVCAIDKKTGELAVVEHRSTRGKTPRHFEIDPTGRYLLAANLESNTVAIFRIDQTTGRLRAIDSMIEVESPMCVKCILSADEK